jgi:hypothetical protein
MVDDALLTARHFSERPNHRPIFTSWKRNVEPRNKIGERAWNAWQAFQAAQARATK